MRACALTGCTVLAGVLCACAPPLMEYDLHRPAATVSVVGATPVTDGRARFRTIFCGVLESGQGVPCADYLARLEDEPPAGRPPAPLPAPDTRLRVLIVPGAFAECLGEDGHPFRGDVERLRALGYRIEYAHVCGRCGSEHNAAQVADAVVDLDLHPGTRLLLVGYSKGINDILAFLVSEPELSLRVQAVLSVAGAVNGSPAADGAAASYQRWLAGTSTATCPAGDGQVVESLRRDVRLRWLARHPLPAHVRYYSLVSVTHPAEMPRALVLAGDKLRWVDPLNDGQVIHHDQVVPGSVVLGYLETNHWAVALDLETRMPFWTGNPQRDTPFPRGAVLESALLFIGEDLAQQQPAP